MKKPISAEAATKFRKKIELKWGEWVAKGGRSQPKTRVNTRGGR